MRRWGAVRASTSFPTVAPTVVPTATREPSADGLALGIVEAPFPTVVVVAAAAAAVGLTRELTGRPGVGSCAARAEEMTKLTSGNQGQSRAIEDNQGAPNAPLVHWVDEAHEWHSIGHSSQSIAIQGVLLTFDEMTKLISGNHHNPGRAPHLR